MLIIYAAPFGEDIMSNKSGNYIKVDKGNIISNKDKAHGDERMLRGIGSSKSSGLTGGTGLTSPTWGVLSSFCANVSERVQWRIGQGRGYSSTAQNSDGIIKIIREITTNPLYVKISQILNTPCRSDRDVASLKVSLQASVHNEVDVDVDNLPLNNSEKQIQIEEILRFFWNVELNKMFKDKKSLFSNSIGINILMNSLSKLDNVLNMVKTDKRLLNNKTYINHIILSENGIIVLSNIIPHIMKYKMSQNTASLYAKIGKDLHSNLLNVEWNKYKKSDNYKINLGGVWPAGGIDGEVE